MADRFSAGVERIDWSDRFWRQVAPEALSGCWLWMGAIRKTDGYGHFSVYVRRGAVESHIAHRYVLEQKLGRPLVDGEVARHTCDVRACVNPDHLIAGSVRDNHHDAMRRGRHSHGSRHGCAKVSEADVIAIRLSTESGVVLADRYGLSPATVSDIRKRKIWRHVGGRA